MSFVVNNHEGEKDENSGYEIHQHLQHQDDDVQGSQCPFFVIVTKKNESQKIFIKLYNKLFKTKLEIF